MNLEEEVIRAEKARQVLQDPMVLDALNDIETAVISQWHECPVKDQDMRERLWMMYGVSKQFRKILQSHIETGELAKAQLFREQTLLEKMKERFL